MSSEIGRSAVVVLGLARLVVLGTGKPFFVLTNSADVRTTKIVPKFFITGLYHSERFSDESLPPLEVEAPDRVTALCSIPGVTVWTEEEWEERQITASTFLNHQVDTSGS